MIPVRNHDGSEEIFLSSVDQFTTAHDAAMELWASVHEAAKKHGGKALLRTPDDGEWGYLVRWEHGPNQWADAYVVSQESDAPGFTASAENGIEVRFVDLD